MPVLPAQRSTAAVQATAAADSTRLVLALGNMALASGQASAAAGRGRERGRETGLDSNHPFSAGRAVDPVHRGNIDLASHSAPADVG